MNNLKNRQSGEEKTMKHGVEPRREDLLVAWSWDCLRVNSQGRTEVVGNGFTDDSLLKFARYIHGIMEHGGAREAQYAIFLLRQLMGTCFYLAEMGYR